ncbi:MAG: hypothetical protein RBJ76_15590 [Stenomitos frigidus ULC029]
MIQVSQLRRHFSAFLLAVVLFLGSGFVGFYHGAIAAPLTPEAAAYESKAAGTMQNDPAKPQQQAQGYKKQLQNGTVQTQQVAEEATTNAKNALERAADNVREKLNLDEPVPQSTKDFLNDIKP